ncbi:MAG: hypothetical protein ABUL44_04290, partial [Flavobacterium sp.]
MKKKTFFISIGIFFCFFAKAQDTSSIYKPKNAPIKRDTLPGGTTPVIRPSDTATVFPPTIPAYPN